MHKERKKKMTQGNASLSTVLLKPQTNDKQTRQGCAQQGGLTHTGLKQRGTMMQVDEVGPGWTNRSEAGPTGVRLDQLG